MDSITADDINALIDAIFIAVLVVCFCLGWVAGSIR